MRNILCFSAIVFASIIAVINAAPAPQDNLIPAAPLEDNQDVGTFDEMLFEKSLQMMDTSSTDPNQMANPPLDRYRVIDIQRLSYPNFAKFYTDLVKRQLKNDPDGNINAYMNQLDSAFDKARAPGTHYTDNVIISVILSYRSFGYLLEPEPSRFVAYQQGLLDMFLPTLPATDAKDVKRIILALGNTYY